MRSELTLSFGFNFENADFSEKPPRTFCCPTCRNNTPFSFSMCNFGKSNLDVKGDKDYSKDELDSKEFYSKEDEELGSEEDCSKDELDREEVYSKDELDADKGYSLDNEFYNDEEHFIARPYDLALKKANLILDNTLASPTKHGKSPTTESETTYLVKLKNKFSKLFKLGYELIITKCKCDDQGRWVYEPRPMAGPDL
jgi:hypothetical protein